MSKDRQVEPPVTATFGGRRPFFDYLKFNLPRTTKAAFILVAGLLGVTHLAAAALLPASFPGAPVLSILLGACFTVFLVVALLTRLRPWFFGLVACVASVLLYALVVWQRPNSAGAPPVELLALWNLTLLLPLAYLTLYWALRRGILVAHPDQRNWHD